MSAGRGLGLSLALLLLGASCGGGAVRQADLVADPAHQLRMPGAVELAHVGNDRRATVEGEQDPFDGWIYGTQASADEVLAFYAAELTRLGWKPDRYRVVAATTEVKAWGWCKPGVRFRLAIDREGTNSPALYKGQSYATTFDATMIGRDPKVTCPGR